LSEYRAHRHSWCLTLSLTVAFASSMLAAIGIWTGPLCVIATAFSGLSLAIWLKVKALWNPVWRDQAECAEVRHEPGSTRSPVEGDPGAIASQACEGGSGADGAVRICYEIAARISHADAVSKKAGREIAKGIEDIGGICTGLREALMHLTDVPAGRNEGGHTGDHDAYAPDASGVYAGAYRNSVGSMLEEVTAAVREMAEVLRQIDHNAKELITSTEETTYSMSRLDLFLQDMASSGRELEASTDTANRVALEGTKVVGEMGKENEAIITAVKEAACAVEDLGRWSQEVGKIVEVIRDIADETNLLALNAAIIAAQSGEHGKAFGVVAEEIRGLAERTSSSTKEISDLVNAVQQNTANVVKSMKKSLQRVERGELLTRNAGKVLEKVFESFESSRSLAKQIATSTFEHKIDSSHVVRSLHKVADIARRIEAPKLAKWGAVGETLATARMLKALSVENQGAATMQASPDTGGGITVSHSVKALTVDDGTGNMAAITTKLTSDIDKSLRALECVRRNLLGLLGVIDEAAGAVRSAARQLPDDIGRGSTTRCWEITGCPAGIRERCAAYRQADWRCFLTDGAACACADTDDKHGQRKCHECIMFENSMRTRVSNAADSEQ
jgi:hypothetical protein